TLIAAKYVEPLSVSPRGYKLRDVHMVSSQVPFSRKHVAALNEQIRTDRVVFEAKSSLRTTSNLGGFFRYSYWLHGHCKFAVSGPPSGVLVAKSCVTKRMNSRGEISLLKDELRSCDDVIDKGECSREVVHKRSEILNKIHQVNTIQASEIAQKANIKWAVEGDENVKFFHGMLNKKRSQSNIRGVMVNGMWVDDQIQVKLEFFDHFRDRFDKPSENRACIDSSFSNFLSNDQKEDLERKITKEEVKRVVWDCGVDKSPGPDGFSFSFYRHF
nr:RNA-directed DNA polymerase, eukaryota [Tanacetum cinerariifolium]